MTKRVKFVADLGEFRAGEILMVEDQIACGAIASGYAVPTEDPCTEQAVEAAPEATSDDQAPEGGEQTAAPENTASGAAPEAT